jgi:predicted secreted protein
MINGVPIGSIVAIYFVAWWLCLFVTLPFGVRSQREAGDVVRGSEPGAPILHRLVPKLLVTSILAALVTAFVIWAFSTEALRAYLR